MVEELEEMIRFACGVDFLLRDSGWFPDLLPEQLFRHRSQAFGQSAACLVYKRLNLIERVFC